MSEIGGVQRGAYNAWHESVSETPEEDFRAPWHQAVLPYLHLAHGRRVLEIGCGRGAFARHVASLGPSLLVACDYSEVAVRMAADLSQEPDYAVADIQRLPFAEDSFDLVISCETIEHVPNPSTAVAELSRVLRPGGTLLLTTPNYLGIMGLFRIYKRLTGDPFTEVGQPINKLVMLPRTRMWVRRAGLRVVESFAYHHYLPIPGRPPRLLSKLDGAPVIGRRLGLHSFVRAVK